MFQLGIANATGDRAMCIFYTADHSVAETIALSHHAKEIGAEAIILWVPYEWATSQDLMHDYVEYVAGKVDIAIIAFNTPKGFVGNRQKRIAISITS